MPLNCSWDPEPYNYVMTWLTSGRHRGGDKPVGKAKKDCSKTFFFIYTFQIYKMYG